MHVIGTDYLTLFGLHPVDYIETAAKAGAQSVAFFPASMEPLPQGHAAFSILDDAALRRDIRSALDATGLRLGMIDGLAVWPGRDVGDYEKGLAGLAEIGVTLANSVSFDTMDRSLDQFGRLAEMAKAHGIRLILESCPVLTVRTLAEARHIAETIGNGAGVLIDTLHVSRTGEAGLVAQLDPAMIGYVQICDAPAKAPADDAGYMDQAMYERMIPGEGGLPLAQIIDAIPDDVIISVEVPLRGHLQAGMSPGECARLAIEGTRNLLRSRVAA